MCILNNHCNQNASGEIRSVEQVVWMAVMKPKSKAPLSQQHPLDQSQLAAINYQSHQLKTFLSYYIHVYNKKIVPNNLRLNSCFMVASLELQKQQFFTKPNRNIVVLHMYGNLFLKSLDMTGDASENVFLQQEE